MMKAHMLIGALAGPPMNLSLSIADLRSIYLFLNSSGLLTLPWAGP
uniref:Lymphocyte antigen-6 G5B splicing isoform 178 n=1 Tax=Bos taurus TaxID=9913 RepID=N0E6J7_BOVIN|nr:lymphocyte antigen-6 G5B splicing isoform 178 [Bos taurus]